VSVTLSVGLYITVSVIDSVIVADSDEVSGKPGTNEEQIDESKRLH